MSQMWDQELTEEETDELVKKAAHEIRKRKLETPAVLMLEMHKPLAYVSSQAAIVFSPFLVPFVGFDNVNNYSRLLSKRDNIERLLVELERNAEIKQEESEA